MTRTWLITGVNSGFGREMARQLLARGDRVAGTVRRAEAVGDLQTKYGEQLWIGVLDVTDFTRIATVVDRAFAELGRIDVVVNNAGYALFGPVEGLTSEQIRHQIDTNLLGPIHVAKAVLPHLRAQGGGRLLAMSTYGGQAALPGASMYHAGKWGLEGFFDSLAFEVAPFGIQVTILEPGGAGTSFRETAAAQMAADLEAYSDTPVGALRARLQDASRPPIGDIAKMVGIMIGSVDQDPAPRRIALGSDAFSAIVGALQARLSALQAQKKLAQSTDLRVSD